jgi:hypothetical protein
VYVARAGLDDEEAVQAPEGHRAVDVKEVNGKNRGGLGIQELPPRCIGVPLRRRRDPQSLEDPADRRHADPVAELQQLALILLYPQLLFSVASRSMSVVISVLTGGRPVPFG